MRMRDHEQTYYQLGRDAALVSEFTTALEKELCSYAFNMLVDVEALVRYADVPGFPKLCIRVSWPGPDQCMHHFEASIPLKELKALSEETTQERDIYFYHLARMMLSSLALARRMDAAEEIKEVEL